ncbi:MAG TPA: amidohydrolase, partial [Dyadobacter sp.]|nr:amidohydrolase [Dyadobacter sp.]
MKLLKLAVLSLCFVSPVFAQDPNITPPLGFEEYDPISTLKVEEHPLKRAKFPFIDVHNHQYQMPTQDLKALVAQMDSLNMGIMVNLSGRGWTQEWAEGTETLKGSLANVAKNEPKRIAIFTNLQFKGFGEKDWTARAVKQLEEDVKAGAKGLKIYKSLGFAGIKDDKGNRVPVSAAGLQPIWQKCGELGIPVI